MWGAAVRGRGTLHAKASQQAHRQGRAFREEQLNETRTRRVLEDSFRNGEVKTTGTYIDKLITSLFRFDDGNRAAKKQTTINMLKAFLERFYGVGDSRFIRKNASTMVYDTKPVPLQMIAEVAVKYGEHNG